MKKVGYVLIIIALSTMSFLLIKKIEIKEEEKNNVEEYLDITSTKKIEKKKEDDVKKETSSYREINYTAILEIPSINLKSGVVDNTKNFDSIRYAISVIVVIIQIRMEILFYMHILEIVTCHFSEI